MNYLAHQHLSFNEPYIQIGNILADILNIKEQKLQRKEIQFGIQIHRFIDEFTDTHSIVKECIQKIRPIHGKYSTVVIDILFDYFLGKNWAQFSDMNLFDFSQKIYKVLDDYYLELPPNLQKKLPYMIKENWFYNYKTYEGIEIATTKIAKRAKFENNMDKAINTLKKNEDYLNKQFLKFYPELKKATYDYYLRLKQLN